MEILLKLLALGLPIFLLAVVSYFCIRYKHTNKKQYLIPPLVLYGITIILTVFVDADLVSKFLFVLSPLLLVALVYLFSKIKSIRQKSYEDYENLLARKRKEVQKQREDRIQHFKDMQIGLSYKQVETIIGNEGLLLSSKSGNGIEVQSKNYVCPNCGGAYDSTKDDVCPFCGAINIKDTVVIKDDFVQDEYIWYFDNKSAYIKAIFKNDKLISKVQQGLY